jgi:hypothetical protein
MAIGINGLFDLVVLGKSFACQKQKRAKSLQSAKTLPSDLSEQLELPKGTYPI